MPKPLNRKTAEIGASHPERIVQFGAGNFLRAFIDRIIEELNNHTDFAGSVVIVKPTPHGSYEVLTIQEGLFHVRLHGLNDGKPSTDLKLVTCVSRSVNPYEDFEAFLALARQPEVRFIVSNTTESGIVFEPEDRFVDAPPSSFPAKSAIFLYQRYQHFQGSADKGCIILPCELIERNGEQLKAIILQYADLWELDPDFKRWLEVHNQFCNTLVDRIVSGFPQAGHEAIFEEIGFEDQLLVEGEQYHSWIVEGPDWIQQELPVYQTNLNVQIVDDLTAYREMKVRILNGAHTAMVPIGYMLGLETVREAVEHPNLGRFIRQLIFEEIIPALGLPQAELNVFAEGILERFRNPFLQHRLMSIALNSTSKFKTRLLPSLKDYSAQHHDLPRRIVFAFAALIRFYKGDWAGEPIPLNDDPAVIAWLQEQWQSGMSMHSLVTEILKNAAMWDQDLTKISGLVDLLTHFLDRIETDDMLQIMDDEGW